MRKANRKVWATAVTSVLVVAVISTLSAQEVGLERALQREFEVARAAEADGHETYYPQDPADSLYRAAREQLNRNNYRQAADMFRELYRRYPRSSYAAQALYYQAFALYRTGGSERNLREAERALRELQREHRDSEVSMEEAEALLVRIQGELARRGESDAAEVIAGIAGGAGEGGGRQACVGEEDEMRVAALNALLQMNSERAIPILERVLQQRDEDNECMRQMRHKAVFLLAQHLDEDNIDILLDVVRNDPDPEIRSEAVFWLSQVPGERTVAALEDILRNSQERELQEKAIFALSQASGERAGEVLKDYAMRQDAPVDLRADAIFWLSQRGEEVSAAFMRDIYRSTTEPEIKEKVIFSLAQMMSADDAEFLLEIAGDANEDIEFRKNAMFWAGQGGVSAVKMAELYETMPERELKESIIFSLAQQGGDEAVDKLLEIARTEKDTELRKKAIFWLSQTDDPRVAEFLLELIEGGG